MAQRISRERGSPQHNTRLNLDAGRVCDAISSTRTPTALVTASGWEEPRGCFHCIVLIV